MRRESNPALAAGFEKAVSDGTTMTVGGTIVKILIMTAILGVAFVYSWIAFQNPDVNYKSALVVSLCCVSRKPVLGCTHSGHKI